MASVPEALAPERQRPAPDRERVTGDVPADVAERLRLWAVLRRKKPAHIVAELVIAAVPDNEQLKGLFGQKGGRDGQSER